MAVRAASNITKNTPPSPRAAKKPPTKAAGKATTLNPARKAAPVKTMSMATSAPKATSLARPASKAAPRTTPRKRENAATEEERNRMICEAAYFLAESRGFVGGDPGQDWIEAERQIDEMLNNTR